MTAGDANAWNVTYTEVGVFEFSCTANDSDGLTASKSISVTVPSIHSECIDIWNASWQQILCLRYLIHWIFLSHYVVILGPELTLVADDPLVIGNDEGDTVTGNLICNSVDPDNDIEDCVCTDQR